MRAIFHSFYQCNDLKQIIVEGEAAKHLQVVRVKLGEEVLVLNGEGLKALTKISSISKQQIELTVTTCELIERSHQISLAIANPKKDAFEDILKIAVELGVQNIFPLKSDFSQFDYLKSDRVDRILESALVQSNNAYFPQLHNQQSLEHFLKEVNLPLYFCNSKQSLNSPLQKSLGDKVILIGPEGGFSPREEALILSKPGVISIHMPTPIQRAPTAVASSIGYLLSP
jgi:16S rRNA (uracil1498-N3)-methyltransferase